MIVHKSRKKAVRITVAGFLAGIAGGLILYCVRDVVLGWCFVATAGFTLLYGCLLYTSPSPRDCS